MKLRVSLTQKQTRSHIQVSKFCRAEPERSQGGVLVGIELDPHRREVHGLLYHLVVAC